MLEEWLRGKTSGEKDMKRMGWINKPIGRYIMVAAICLGLLALIWPIGRTSDSTAVPPASPTKAADDAVKSEMTASLETILSQVKGAGVVEVNLSLASNGQKSYASNSRDESREIREGSTSDGSKLTNEETRVRDLAVSGGSPLLVENKMPEVLGVLVVADGADRPEVAERLMEATATLLKISPHQVSIMPREKK
ncbi:MAG: hypothetical protein ACM3PE_12515 [Deltaproteobacteria bacterium]